MIEYILSLILGLFIGSFLNCVVYRVYHKKTFLKGHSFCPKCNHNLSVLDLIPIFSYLSLKGKCRYCKEPISKQYLFVELITGVVFFLVAYLLNASFLTQGFLNLEFLNLIFYFFVASYFIMIFIFDLKWFIIPDGLTFSGIAVTLFYLILSTFLNVLSVEELFVRVLTAFIVFLFFFALYFFSEGKAMGFGDVKLVVFLGLLLGFPNILPALFIAFFLGAVIGLIMMMFKKKGMKSEIPFGPFLVFGTFVSLFFGEYFISWYLNLM